MKTTSDIEALIPAIVDLVADNDHEIGECYMEQSEDGRGCYPDYATNHVHYDEDGWCIEISYKCCGEWDNDPGDYWTPPSRDLIRAWGKVSEITACYYDEIAGEETEFSSADLLSLRNAINETLKDIA